MGTHGIKVREKGGKAWWFVSPRGTTRLRIHASRWPEAYVKSARDELIRLNDHLNVKVIKF